MNDKASEVKLGQEYSLAHLAEFVDAELIGDANIIISGLSTLANAGPGQLTFLANPAYKKHLSTTRASAIILRQQDAVDAKGALLVVDNPYLAYAKLTALFTLVPAQTGIHPSAVIDTDVQIGAEVSIAANVVIEAGVSIGRGCVIGPGTFIGRDSQLGEQGRIHANVSIYNDVTIGDRAIFHSGVVVGSDGFGFAPDGEQWTKIHQLGGVVIGDDVELGAATCIDRGALDNTVIGNGVKVDNLVHIAHNVKIGDNCILCGCSGVAGSTTIGANCVIGGAVGIINHLSITSGVTVTAGSLVTKSISTPGIYSSGTPLMSNAEWRKNAATFPRLYSLYQNQKKHQKS